MEPSEALPITRASEFADEQFIASRHPFPISSQELIRLAKDVLDTGVEKAQNLAGNFHFSAPFIGPLAREEFRNTLQTLDLNKAFPDLAPQYYNFSVDPFETNRVWFFLRPVATHLGPFKGKLPKEVQATGRCIAEPPQVGSLTFNENREVIGHTMGYVADRTIGTTRGLGGAFGLLVGIGCPLPVPEGKPWRPSLQLQAFNSGNTMIQGALFMFDRVASFFNLDWLFTKHSRNNM